MRIRIAELSSATGVPTRTIRYYTQQGLLPAPDLEGRIGYYGDAHVERLKLIRELREKRFLPLDVIRSVVRRYEQGDNLETMLTPLDLVFGGSGEDPTEEISRSELARRAAVAPKTVEAAERMGFLFGRSRGNRTVYTNSDIAMAKLAHEWIECGLPEHLGRLYRVSYEQIAREHFEVFNEVAVQPLAVDKLTPEEAREQLLAAYKQIAVLLNRVAASLHQRLLREAVTSHPEIYEHGWHEA